MRISRQLAALSASLLIGGAVVAEDFEATLERARQAAVEHHYEEAIELLVPFRSVREPEIQYIVAAESGRAFFHLGRYQEAHSAFRQAVRLFPTRVESAIYLLATSYLKELLDSGVPAVLVDMSGIDNVDSTGLGELVGYLQRFEKEGRRMALLRPHSRILSLLRLTRLDEIFSIFEDRDDAIRDLQASN
ncbi:MAG: STAS domain-containing protein [Acidobacteriota bacterium]